MDGAVEVVPTAAPRLVTAAELSHVVNANYGGDVPPGLRFFCPYCGRPVRPVAVGRRKVRQDSYHFSGRRSTAAWAVSSHFKHMRADEAARQCELYQGGEGQAVPLAPPALLMFLRRETGQASGQGPRAGMREAGRNGRPGRSATERNAPEQGLFRIELRLRRRNMVTLRKEVAEKDGALAEGDRMMVEGRPYPLLRQVTDRRTSIVLEHPTFRMDRITVPGKWQRFVGRPQSATHDAFVFSDAFGGNGGRRLAEGSAVRTGMDYYVVANPEQCRNLDACFDQVDVMGRVRGAEGRMMVCRVRVMPGSARWASADNWLTRHGLYLSDYDASAQLMWPPSLRSAGVDEPMFVGSTPIYRHPMPSGDVSPDHVSLQRVGARTTWGSGRSQFRSVGFVGFERGFQPARELEASCLFLRPTPRMPWNAVVVGWFAPEGLVFAQVGDAPVGVGAADMTDDADAGGAGAGDVSAGGTGEADSGRGQAASAAAARSPSQAQTVPRRKPDLGAGPRPHPSDARAVIPGASARIALARAQGRRALREADRGLSRGAIIAAARRNR